MLRTSMLICLLAFGVCESSPVRHRRPGTLFRAIPEYDQETELEPSSNQLSEETLGLLDLSGVYSGTWIRLEASSHTKSSSTSRHFDELPPVLLGGGNGKIVLRLTAGPTPRGEELAGIEGVLQMSEGSLLFGSGLQQLDLSGITRVNPDGRQALHAVLKAQQPVFAAKPSSSRRRRRSSSRRFQVPEDDKLASSSISMGGWIRGRQQQRQQQPQRQQQQQLSLAKQQVWLRGRRGPLMGVIPAAETKQQHLGSIEANKDVALASSRDQEETHIDEVEAGGDTPDTANEPEHEGLWELHRGLNQQDGTRSVRCRFRLELAVTPAQQAMTATAAAAGRGRSLRSAKAAVLQSQGLPEPQQQQQQADADDEGEDGAVADDTSASLAALYSLKWQHAAELASLVQQQQQAAVLPDIPLSLMRSVDNLKAADVVGQLKGQPAQFPDVSAAATNQEPAQGLHRAVLSAVMLAEEEAVGPESPSYSKITEQRADAVMSIAFSHSPLVQEVQLLPVDPDTAQLGSSDDGQALRTLHSRSFPALPVITAGSSSQASSLHTPPSGAAHSDPSAEATLYTSPSNMQAVNNGVSVRQAAPPSHRIKQRPASLLDLDGSSTSPGPVSLIDNWLLPCSHPQQIHHPHCRQQQRQQQRMVIQGLLLSDNCNASWSITAVALAPGGLARQAMCYAISALLLCLAQVVLLRRQARLAQSSPAAALKLSLVGVCAGSQLDACLSMAHLAAALAAPDISLPLLVVAAAQFALFAGADMTLLLHVWRAHNHHGRRRQQQQEQQAQQPNGPQHLTGFDRSLAAGVDGSMAAASLVPWRQQWSAALAAVAAAVSVQVQDQAEGLREFATGSSGSSLIDVLLLGLVQLLTGQSLVLLYVRFYLVLLAATLISWSLASQIPLLLLVAFSFWVPQILYNIQHSTKQALVPAYIIAASVARVLLPLYLLSCPGNMLQLTPQSWLAVAVVVWLGLQAVVLLLQHYVGPHVLLPPAWVPDRYNYHRLELPWQFKQQIAEMQKLGLQQQQELTPAAATPFHHRCSCCECNRINPCCISASGQSVTATASSLVDHQQQWHCRAGAPAPSGGGNCSCRFSMVSTSGGRSAPTRQSDLSSSSCWGSFSGGNSSSSSAGDCEMPQQQPCIRLRLSEAIDSLTATGANSCSQQHWRQQQQQQEQQELHCQPQISPQSDAYYISMLGATVPPPALSTASPTYQHRPQQEPCLGPAHLPNSPVSPLMQQQAHLQHQCCHHVCCYPCLQASAHPLPHGSGPATPASNRGVILAHSSSSSSSQVFQTWLGQGDETSHDVDEGYDMRTGQGVVECVICMAGVTLLPVAGRCVTPCGHFFHRECLANWVEVKAECPTCRGPLPPL